MAYCTHSQWAIFLLGKYLMNIYVQWTQQNVVDAFGMDHTAWLTLAKRPVPKSGEKGGLDDIEGWIMALTVMGLTFSGDHYRVTNGLDSILVIVWCDDPDDGDQLIASESSIFAPGPDEALDSKYNTNIVTKVYADPITLEGLTFMFARSVRDEVIDLLPYSEFKVPADDMNTRHGIWVTDKHYEEHQAARTQHGWKDWIGQAI